MGSSIRCMHISDTHQENIADIVITDLKAKKIESVDLLFISGDLTYRGDIDKLKAVAEQCEDLVLCGYVKDVVLTPGNHDKSFDHKFRKSAWFSREIALKQFKGRMCVHLLIHESIQLHGIKIFASPWTPEFHDWGFNYFPHEAKDLWDSIPNDCEVLMTHGPPEFILDEVNDYMKTRHTGCPYLAKEIVKRPTIKYHLFGHIHEGYGKLEKDGITYLNSSIMDLRYKPNNKPQYFSINKKA